MADPRRGRHIGVMTVFGGVGDDGVDSPDEPGIGVRYFARHGVLVLRAVFRAQHNMVISVIAFFLGWQVTR